MTFLSLRRGKLLIPIARKSGASSSLSPKKVSILKMKMTPVIIHWIMLSQYCCHLTVNERACEGESRRMSQFERNHRMATADARLARVKS